MFGQSFNRDFRKPHPCFDPSFIYVAPSNVWFLFVERADCLRLISFCFPLYYVLVICMLQTSIETFKKFVYV